MLIRFSSISKSLMLGSFVCLDRVSKQGRVSTRDGRSMPYRSSNSNLDSSPNGNISAFCLILQARHEDKLGGGRIVFDIEHLMNSLKGRLVQPVS